MAESSSEPLAAFDLRLRSLDRQPGEPIDLCSRCGGMAVWSVWLHTPDWGPEGGATRVLCHTHALHAVKHEAGRVLQTSLRKAGEDRG